MHCHALHWLHKHIKGTLTSAPQFSRCCHHSKVNLNALPDPPERLRDLFTAETTEGREFWEHIRRYNSALTFTSFSTRDSNKNMNAGGSGPWVWKSGYTIYHCIRNIFPEAQQDPSYAQLYFYDPQDALDLWMDRNDHLSCQTMNNLQNMLLESNCFTRLYLHSFKILENTPSTDLKICIVADPSTDLRRYNKLFVDEIAIVLPGDQSRAVNPCNVILHHCEGGM